MPKLEISQKSEGDTNKIFLSGGIDEEADFQKIDLNCGKIHVDLENVTMINSTGILRWLTWIRLLTKKEIQLFNCPRIFIDQLNMVAGFLPSGAKVISFYVPYFCEKAGTERNVLFTNGKEVVSGQVILPQSVKDEKGNLMEVNIYPDRYFKFVKLYT